MKTVTVLESEDLKFIDDTLTYFLFGNKKFFDRNMSKQYLHNFSEADFIKAGELISKDCIFDFKHLKEHICANIDDDRKSLTEAKLKVDNLEKSIERRKELLELVASKSGFNEAIMAILDLKEK